MRRMWMYVPILALLVAGCTQIWNAGDLVGWVEQQAVAAGCDTVTIALDDWYTTTEDGNVWMGTCVDASSGDTVELAINVDSVWTPSQAASSDTTSSVTTSSRQRRSEGRPGDFRSRGADRRTRNRDAG